MWVKIYTVIFYTSSRNIKILGIPRDILQQATELHLPPIRLYKGLKVVVCASTAVQLLVGLHSLQIFVYASTVGQPLVELTYRQVPIRQCQYCYLPFGRAVLLTRDKYSSMLVLLVSLWVCYAKGKYLKVYVLWWDVLFTSIRMFQ